MLGDSDELDLTDPLRDYTPGADDTGEWLNCSPVTLPDDVAGLPRYTFTDPSATPAPGRGYDSLNPGAIGQPEETPAMRTKRREEFGAAIDRAMAEKVEQYERVIDEARRNASLTDPPLSSETCAGLGGDRSGLYRFLLLVFASAAVLVAVWFFGKT